MVAPSSRETSIREKLAGYPAGTADALVDYLRQRDAGKLDRVVHGILQHHLPVRPDAAPLVVAECPGSTRLQEDLQIDSLTFAELAFLVEDILGYRVPEEELQGLRSIDDFRGCLERAVAHA